MQDKQFIRRFDLDFLRIFAFGLLIFYHIGMFYVTWGWHVKSVYASDFIEPLMLTVNPWRLALLFFISGVAIRFASDSASSRWRFMRSRFYRLGLPILAGLFVVVVPQTYFELRQSGLITSDFWSFYQSYLDLDQVYLVITPTWNHLWYIVYLLVYIALTVAFLPLMQRWAAGPIGTVLAWIAKTPWTLLLIVPVPFIIYELTLSSWFPTTHALVDDWGNHAHRFTIFLLGYFVAKHECFWQGVDRAFKLALILTVLTWIVRFFIDLPGLLEVIVGVVYAWSSIVSLLAIAQRYLNQSSRWLSYLTGAIFFYYIAHQTVIVSAGYWLTQKELGALPEFSLVLIVTLGACMGGYEVIRRIPFIRPWFGIFSRH